MLSVGLFFLIQNIFNGFLVKKIKIIWKLTWCNSANLTDSKIIWMSVKNIVW
jgi:hypothetical protein